MTAAERADRGSAAHDRQRPGDDPEAPLRAELARLMLEGARRLLREQEQEIDRKRRRRGA